MSIMGGKHSVLASGKFEFDTLVRCTGPKGNSECRVDKIVNRGNWQH